MQFFGSSLVALATVSAVGAFALQPSTVKISRPALMASEQIRISTLKASNDEDLGFATAGSKDLDLLGLPARPGRPLKVAIAGGGVGGLTTALCMLKKGFDVTVYEKTSAFARFGGPIQFASNALSVLKEIDDKLFDRIMEKFTFTGIRTCGIKDGTKEPFSLCLCCRCVFMLKLYSLFARSTRRWLFSNDE
jgi:NAD(P)-binding Rossmann-like domain